MYYLPVTGCNPKLRERKGKILFGITELSMATTIPSLNYNSKDSLDPLSKIFFL